MSTRMLAILTAAVVVALALAFVLADRSADAPQQDGDRPLLPGLSERINDIQALDIVAPDGRTVATLRRERERWRMREKHDYEADFARIHGLLRDLAQARRLEARTDQPEWHARLGVAEPGQGEGSGTLVRFPGVEIAELIVGKRDPAGIGRYARLSGEAQAWLTGRDLELPVDRMDWLERAIMDIPAADIREVAVRHPDGDRVELRPGDAEGNVWVMLDPPAGREVEQGWQLRQAAASLAKLNMADVRPHEAATVPDDAVDTVFRTRDGLVFSARTFTDEAGDWVHFRVRRDEAGLTATNPGDRAGEQRESESDVAEDAHEAQERAIDVVAVDGRLSPWQFALEADRFERLRPTTEDLLVAPEESATD